MIEENQKLKEEIKKYKGEKEKLNVQIISLRKLTHNKKSHSKDNIKLKDDSSKTKQNKEKKNNIIKTEENEKETKNNNKR